ncbi:MAG: protein-disulfide reductase DsbD domain-containing protein, partial [Hyphomonadaceae bacterium]
MAIFKQACCLASTLILALWAAVFLAPAGPAWAQGPHLRNAAVSLHSARAAIAPGETFTVVLRQEIRGGWHTYWRNPGDSGQATQIDWTMPVGFSAGPLRFPAPKRIPVDVLMNYGYAGEVLFPIEITAPRRLRPGRPVTLQAHASWLVCSDICIPEEEDVALTLPVMAAGADDPEWAPRVAAALAALPQPAQILGRVTPTEKGGLLTFVGAPVRGARDVHFFPYAGDVIDHAAPENPSRGALGVALEVRPARGRDLGALAFEGVL